MKKILLSLKNVSLIRGGKTILKNIGWTIREGEHWFLMGHNGSGKSTLLEVMMGYLWASEGSVEVLGQVYGQTNLPELRKHLGYVAPWVYKRIKSKETVFEVVASGLDASIEFYGQVSAGVSQTVQSALEKMEALDLRGRLFSELSSGEQLKVMIARALVTSPRILILDEPFSSLDIGARFLIHRLVKKMGKQSKKCSIVLVTHHLDDIRDYYSHGIILKNGMVSSYGLKRAVLSAPSLKKAFNITSL